MDNTTDPLQQLLSRTPDDIEAWLRQPDAPTGFNWLGLAEVAGYEAMRCDLTTALAWARVSIAVRYRLADMMGESSVHSGQITDAMRLRTHLINRYGAINGDPVLDCDEIFHWFLDRHADQFDHAAADAGHWHDLPIERIRELRWIKGELNLLRRLDHCTLATSDEVQRWLTVWDQLP